MNFKVLEEVPAPDPGLDQEVVAREITTGRPVVIHFLREKPGPEHNAFLRQLLRLGPNENSYVLESGTFGGRAYIVTKILPENVSLRAWAERFRPARRLPAKRRTRWLPPCRQAPIRSQQLSPNRGSSLNCSRR